MLITSDFCGANITVKGIDGDTVYLENQIRDTTEDWFYWAFCIEGAEGRTVRFVFDKMRVGYFGAAKSHDLKNWEWTRGECGEKFFTYTFAKDENKVYFAHNMVYSPDMLTDFCNRLGIPMRTLCQSEKGREVPFFEVGDGEEVLLLAARHHACESTGNYVIEGIVERFLENPIDGLRIICVPIVDIDGVIDGDQGKARAPYDHNRDYAVDTPPIYSSTRAIKELISDKKLRYAFDCHAPWHFSGENDSVFLVRNSHEKDALIERFARLLEESITPESLPYKATNDHGADLTWNHTTSPTFSNYMLNTQGAEISFTVETTYFDAQGTEFSQEAAREFGRCYAEAIRKYHKH